MTPNIAETAPVSMHAWNAMTENLVCLERENRALRELLVVKLCVYQGVTPGTWRVQHPLESMAFSIGDTPDAAIDAALKRLAEEKEKT